MFKSFFAKNARTSALFIGLSFTLVSMLSVVLIAVHHQWQEIEKGQQLAMHQYKMIREEIFYSLVDLNKNFEPNCTEPNLRKIRELLFKKRYIGDVGIFDESDHMICSTVTGLLPEPVMTAAPDAIARASGGELVLFNVQVKSLLFAKIDVPTSILRIGRFNVVMSVFALETIQNSGITTLKHAFPNHLITLWNSKDLSVDRKIQLDSHAYIDASMQQIRWRDLSFVMVERKPNTTTIVQTIVPFSVFLKNYAIQIIVVWFLLFLIGTLLCHITQPIFLGWSKLNHRIVHLLTEENILCMYQPIVDLATRQPVGCEVLMRLRDGSKVIYPDIALPAIIERGLTWKLDQFVVRKALREFSENLPQLTNFKVAFNFFPNNLVCSNVCTLFKEALDSYPHIGLSFELEVLEQDYQANMLIEMAKLKEQEFLIAVDDFGTGYSNLGSIKAIAPNYLKIDRSFILDMEEESLRSSLIPEIISIGRAVNAKIIAEGIENTNQLALLEKLGVEFGQGYFFARPQPIAEFAASLESGFIAKG